MANYIGSGRAREAGFSVAHKQDLNSHIDGTGGNNHSASNIAVSPALPAPLDGASVQVVLSQASDHVQTGGHDADVIAMSPTLDSPFNGATVQAAIATVVDVIKTPITVGDGVTSFGHFNGQDAIQEALNYAISISRTRAHIYIKKGDYVWTEPSTQMSYRLEGENTQDVIIHTNTDSDGYITSNASQSLYLENLTIQRSVIGALTISEKQNSNLFINNCLIKAPIKLDGTNSKLYISDTIISDSGALVMDPKAGTAGQEYQSFVSASNCSFVSTGTSPVDYPAIQFTGTGLTSNAYVRVVISSSIFSNTTYHSILDASPSVASVGDINATVSFRDCTFINSNLKLKAGTSATNQVLFENISFDNCDFRSMVSGMYIMPYNFYGDSADAGIGTVSIRNCTITDQTVYSAPPSAGLVPSNGYWGGRLSISAKNLSVDGFNLSGTATVASTYADVCVFSNSYNVNNWSIYSSSSLAGSGTVPASRVSIYGASRAGSTFLSNTFKQLRFFSSSSYMALDSNIMLFGRPTVETSLTFDSCDFSSSSSSKCMSMPPDTDSKLNLIISKTAFQISTSDGIFFKNSGLTGLKITDCIMTSTTGNCIDLLFSSGTGGAFPADGVKISGSSITTTGPANAITIVLNGQVDSEPYGHQGPIITDNTIRSGVINYCVNLSDENVCSGIITGNQCFAGETDTTPNGIINLVSNRGTKYWAVVGCTPENWPSAKRFLSAVDISPPATERSFSNAAIIRFA